MIRPIAAALAGAALLACTQGAAAFCGFYVSGADAKLFNNATQVALMREGTRTVLSMQNSYQGPPERFALVVPVPVVLQKENVKTLPREVFDRVDQLAAALAAQLHPHNRAHAVDMLDGAGGQRLASFAADFQIMRADINAGVAIAMVADRAVSG